MPNIDLSKVEESTGMSFEQLPAGAYVCKITGIEHDMSKQYVRIFWDVAEGDFKDHYSQSQWPPCDIASYKEAALGMLKHKLHCLIDSNIGFDAESAFKQDDWDQFTGKLFGAVVRDRLYTKRSGEDGKGIEIGTWYRVSEIQRGEFKLLGVRDARGPKAQVQAQTSQQDELADTDIPF